MSAIVEAARSYLDVPWRHLGRSSMGVDCIGLVILAHRDAGILLDDPAPYTREPSGARIIEGIEGAGARRVSSDEERPGDVLVFRSDGVNGGHVGIAASRDGVPTVIHAYAQRRRVVEEPLTHDLADALIGAWRIEG
jgi:cell wall-associated NlpC family hydrolase